MLESGVSTPYLKPTQLQKKPTGRLLGACSGRRPMGYRFSLLTLLFSGVFMNSNPVPEKSFALFQEILSIPKSLPPEHFLSDL